MPNYIFEGDYSNTSGNISVRLLLVHFKDEEGIHFVYSPHLDVSGYGKTSEEAEASFKIAFEDFIDYTLKKKTLGKVLKNLGWTLKGSLKKPKKPIAPSITSIIGENDYVSEIFDKYSVTTFHQKVKIPAYS